MLGKIKACRLGIITLLLLPACAAEWTGQHNSPTQAGSISDPSKTPWPTKTPVTTIIPTAINTVVPIPSPTEGPPPELELVNASIRYDGHGYGYLYGGIRNNTDAAMVFRSPKGGNDYPLFRFYFKAWEWFEINGIYWIYEFEEGQGSYMRPNTNCLLYPGETGVLRIDPPSCNMEEKNCVYESDFIFEPPPTTGMQLIGYEVIKSYEPWPGLETEYHPKAENIEFSVKNYKIQFGFDLPKSVFNNSAWYDFPAWVLIIGKDGVTLDILFQENIRDIMTEKDDMTYHINGFYKTASSTEESGPGYFLGYLPDKYWDQIDHIKVFVEKQHDFLCGGYQDFEFYRKKILDETS